ncbi:MAG: ABC transporter ATP-binding protein [Pseudomonadota bacterium]|nr:ABC transporter ATP-binding protein [Pseudomonadota bacterium]
MSGVALEIRGLTRFFRKGGEQIDVLRGADLDLAPGDSVALLGQSGSGKSTFLHILGALEPPSSGTVKVDGRELHGRPRAELDAFRNRQVGFVFQFHHLLPDHTAVDNAAMPAIIAGRRVEDARADAKRRLAQVGLGHRLGHKPGELSGGEQQRVALARALMMDPGLLLADEPTGNLDPSTASEVLDLLLDLNRDRRATLVVVTHSAELAARFPRRLRLVDGKFQEAA